MRRRHEFSWRFPSNRADHAVASAPRTVARFGDALARRHGCQRLRFELALDDPPRGEGGPVKGKTDKGRAGGIAVDQLLLPLDYAGVLSKSKIGHVLVGFRHVGVVEPP